MTAVPKRVLRTAPAAKRGAMTEAPRKPITKVEAGRRTTHTAAYKTQEDIEEKVTERQFLPGQDPAFVRVNAGKTFNLGNYESLRIDVSVTLPCLPSEVQQTYEQASDFVAEKLQEEESIWLGNRKQASRRN